MTRASLLSIVALAACSDSAAPSFSIGLDFDSTSCARDSCDGYAMSCGARLSIRIVDANATSDAPYTSQCVELEGDTLCSLDQLDVELGSVPVGRARIEVALWDPAQIGPSCPDEDIFTVGNDARPRADFLPNPAFGGASYVDVGSATEVRVLLHCDDALQLDAPECRDATTVSAGVQDLTTGLFVVPEEAIDLLVSVGEPRTRPTGAGEVEWVLEPGDTTPLDIETLEPVPQWMGEAPRRFGRAACIVVLGNEPQATRTVTCSPAEEMRPQLDLQGYLLPKARLDEILAAAELTTFPQQGLVIGRVVDELGAPAAGVTLVPEQGSVQYLSEDGTTFLGRDRTSSNGYFISRDAPFATRWRAFLGATPAESGEFRAGLIAGKASVLEIRLKEPLALP